ncbi:MAG: hypothetical protein AABP62_19155 [Planctomycetota bacterium]
MAETASKSPESSGSSKSVSYKTRPTGGRWLMRGGWFLVLLATAVWFAPAIVAKTSLRQRIPKLIFPTYPGTVEVGETSIGWFSPIVVRGLKAEDEEGHTLLDVKEFSTVETLWTLATRQTNLGRMRLVDPVMTVSIRRDGSNLEDVYARFMSGPPSTAPVPAFELEIVNARLELANKVASCSSTIESVSLVLASTKGGVNELELTIGHAPSSTDSAEEGQPATVSDWLAVRFGNVPTDEAAAATTDTQHLRLKARGWKLDKLLPALTRFEPAAEMFGEFDADVKAQLRPTKESFDWTWDGTVSLRQLALSGLAALKHDKVSLDSITAGGRFASQAGRLSMDDAKFTTDVGELTATGDIPLTGLTAAQGLNAVQSIVGEEDFQLAGHVDLKRLAALLPQTLRVREGTEITAGRVEVKLIGAEAKGARTWNGGASLAGLTAVNRGETIAWKTPFITAFQAHRQDGAIVVDRLTCQSDFLQVSGGGTLTDAHFTASGDLSKLEQNLERFIDLGLEKIAGRLKVDGSIKREENDRASFVAAVHLDEFQWNVSADNVWHEDRLELIATASARTDGGTNLQRIDSATLRLTSGNDSLSAKLNEAIDLPATSATWPVTATLTGGLGTWQNRLKPFVVLKGWQLAGDANIEAALAAGPRQINLERLAVNINQLQARGLEWFVQEPQLKLETSGVWKVAEMEWSSPQSTLTASSLSCRIDNLDVALTKAGGLARLAGDAAYRADLDKLSRWKNQALERPSYHLVGALSGRATVTEEANLMTADIDANVEKLVIAALQTPAGQPPKWEAMWREPKLHLTGQGSYDSVQDDLKLDASSLSAEGLNVSAKGSMEKLSTAQRVDLTGQLGYDWDVLVQRFGAALGKNIQLTGKDQRPFALKGSLASLTASTGTTASRQVPTRPVSVTNDPNSGTPNVPSTDSTIAGLSDLSGQAGLGWQSAIVYGLTAGPGDVSAKLDKGICQFAPLDTTINEGRLHFTPQIRLDQSPVLIVLPREKVIDQVRLSPELCSSWLKFVMPLLADAAEVEGKFSLDVAGGSLPLMTPSTGEMNGAVAIHQAQVRPGPFSMQLVGLVDQIRAVIRQRAAGDPQRERVWMEMPEQSVDFKLTQGRMHHRMITFQIKDVTLRTSGSVGMDETLNLMAEFGIPDDWIGNTKLLVGLKGKSIRIPIGGTLSRPHPDSRVLGELTQQLGGSALEGLLEKNLDNKLDGLFKKNLNKLLPQ